MVRRDQHIVAALHLVVSITRYLLLLCLLIINGIFTTVLCMITNAMVMGLIHAHLSKSEEKAVVSNPPVARKQRRKDCYVPKGQP